MTRRLELEARILEALRGEGQGGADRGPALRRARRLGELLGEAARGDGAVDHRPVDHHDLVMRAGPFGVAERDALVLARQDGVDHALVGQRLDIAAALQLGLDLVDRARDVDSQHELQVDRHVRAAPASRPASAAREPTSAVRRFMSASAASARKHSTGKRKTPERATPAVRLRAPAI